MCDAEYSFSLWISVRVGVSTAIFQNHRWNILKKRVVSAMIEVQKKENHRRAATPSHVRRFNRTCWKQGGYFFFMATM